MKTVLALAIGLCCGTTAIAAAKDFLGDLANIEQDAQKTTADQKQAPQQVKSRDELFRNIHFSKAEALKQLAGVTLGSPQAAERAFSLQVAGKAAIFANIEAGWFQMGSPGEGDPRNEQGRGPDETLHRVDLNGYFIQFTPVTQLQYVLVMAVNPSAHIKDCDTKDDMVLNGIALCANHPVENVSFNDAQAFIGRMNQVMKDKHLQYRLPTEAEWEAAARGRTLAKPNATTIDPPMPYFDFPASKKLDDYAWYSWNSDHHTHAVATKAANKFGLYEMYGNVRQLTGDGHAPFTTDENKTGNDPVNPADATDKVVRGGSFNYIPLQMRSAYRAHVPPDTKADDLGFRLVMIPDLKAITGKEAK